MNSFPGPAHPVLKRRLKARHVALGFALAASPALAQPDDPGWYTDPAVAMFAAGNMYSLVHGRRALCAVVAPDSLAQVDAELRVFRAKLPTLVDLARKSTYWADGKASSERFNKQMLDRARGDDRKDLVDGLCRHFIDNLFGGRAEGEDELAQRWIRVLRHWNARPDRTRAK